jgi:hypothetical protein
MVQKEMFLAMDNVRIREVTYLSTLLSFLSMLAGRYLLLVSEDPWCTNGKKVLDTNTLVRFHPFLSFFLHARRYVDLYSVDSSSHKLH